MTDDKLDPRVVELLCARLCHDLISPVSAISNGVELITEMGESVGGEAMSLIGGSAGEASRKLQFFRIAFGSARGSSGQSATLADARAGFLELPVGERITLAWTQTPELARAVPREATKMVLNLALSGIDCLAGSGRLEVVTQDVPQAVRLELVASGDRAKLPEEIAAALTDQVNMGELSPKTVTAYYGGYLARRAAVSLATDVRPGMVKISCLIPTAAVTPAS
jgi:histidine phosphotransferase ChpT